MNRRLCFALCLILSALVAPAAAQVFVGTRGASCASIPVSGANHNITLTGAVPVGSALFVAAATTVNATLGSPQVTDSRGNTYTSTIARIHTDNFDLRSSTFVTPVTTALQPGDQVTLHYIAAEPAGETSCASLARFDAVSISTPVQTEIALGEQTTNATTHSISTGMTSHPNLLIFEAVAISGAHGGIGANPGDPLTVACNGANNFCVLPVYRIVNTVGNYTLTANTNNAVRATIAMASYRGVPLLFKDSFE